VVERLRPKESLYVLGLAKVARPDIAPRMSTRLRLGLVPD
jgi:hypothetical protein